MLTSPIKITTLSISRKNTDCYVMPHCTKNIISTHSTLHISSNSDYLHNAISIGYSSVREWWMNPLIWSYIKCGGIPAQPCTDTTLSKLDHCPDNKTLVTFLTDPLPIYAPVAITNVAQKKLLNIHQLLKSINYTLRSKETRYSAQSQFYVFTEFPVYRDTCLRLT